MRVDEVIDISGTYTGVQAVNYTEDSTRADHTFGSDTETQLYLPNGRRVTTLVITHTADLVTYGEERTVGDPGDELPGAKMTMQVDAMATATPTYKIDMAAQIVLPFNTPTSSHDFQGIYGCCDVSILNGPSDPVTTQTAMVSAFAAGASGALDIDISALGTVNCDNGECACRYADPSMASSSIAKYDTSSGGFVDYVSGNGADLKHGIMFSPGAEGIQFPEIDGPSAEETRAIEEELHRQSQELRRQADEDLASDLRELLSKRYPWMSAEEIDLEYRFRKAMTKRSREIKKTCFAQTDNLPSDFWEPVTYRDEDGTLHRDQNAWRVKEGVSPAEAARALEKAVKDETAQFDCAMGVFVAVLLAGLDVATNDDAFDSWFNGRYLGGYKKSLQASGLDSLDYTTEADGADHIEGDWVYFPNDPDYLVHNPGGSSQGDNGLATGAGSDRKMRYKVHGYKDDLPEVGTKRLDGTPDPGDDGIMNKLRQAHGERDGDDWNPAAGRPPRRFLPPGGAVEPAPPKQRRMR